MLPLLAPVPAAWAGWTHTSRQLRASITAVERTATPTGPVEAGRDLDEWLSLARSYANRVDPPHADRGPENSTSDDEEAVENFELP
jgi:hypothetical protein